MTDPIADLLTRIRNAQTAHHESFEVPYSRIKHDIIKLLYEEGFIGSFRLVESECGRKKISIALRYTAKKEPMVSSITRMSRPGRRYYLGYEDIRPVRNGLGLGIFSTSKGLLTDRQAREEKVGGELLFTVW